MTLTRRALLHAALLGTVGLAARAAHGQELWFVTGYLETGSPTASGEPTGGKHWQICAVYSDARGVPRFPYGSLIELDGLGTFRVSDTGRLAWNQVDILVPSLSAALNLTGTYSGRVVG